MRFRSKGIPRGQAFSRAQRRVTVWLLVAVVALIVWRVFLVDAGTPATAGSGNSAVAPVPPSLLGKGQLAPDEFLTGTPTQDSPAEYAKMVDRESAKAIARDVVNATGPDDVPATLIENVRDNVLGVLSSENEAWLGTLVLARKVLANRLQEFPEGQYSLFMSSPDSVRGKPFRIRGELRLLKQKKLPAGAEAFGVKSTWEAWIHTQDSGSSLIHVNALSADAGLPTRELEHGKGVPVEFSGYFFKKEGYAARGGDGQGDVAVAPLLLTDHIRMVRLSAVQKRGEDLDPWLVWAAGLLFLGVLLVLWRFQSSDAAFRETRTHQLTTLPVRPSFEGVDSVPVEQALREMEDHARMTSNEVSILSQDRF